MIKKLGRYDIQGIVGRGSMGVVYKGIDPQIGKLVAIKTMNPKVLTQVEMQERFYREGTILGQLQHKNIISVYNVGTDGDTCYIAMEYLDGISLGTILEQKQKLSYLRILKIIKQVAEGVNAAHKMTVTHRDLKPANIFVLDGDLVKVLDFGIAHFKDSQLTNSGMLLGTINYIAPEQITGLKVDHRSDIFSIGVVLYELLTGINPFLSKSISKTMVKIVNEDPPKPEGVPRVMVNILKHALHKDRKKRYQSLQQMAADIDVLLRDIPINGAPDDSALLEQTPQTTPTLSEHKVKNAQNDILEKMIVEHIEGIKHHLSLADFDQAEDLLCQLKRLKTDHPALADLSSRLDKARRLAENKKAFAEKVHHGTLLKANGHLSERHYVLALELCNKVLAVDHNNSDARVMRARCLHILEQFLRDQKALD